MILNLDCRAGLAMLADNSVDAIVTDPPYGLNFMGKKWDCDVPGVDIWAECLRVLKPGGRLLAFAGTRTQHRMAVNIEDAGFQIEDLIAWVYGSGLPKHKSKLKPAFEPITVAIKPARTAALLNIDACRVDARYPANLIHDGSDEVLALFPDSKGAGSSLPQVKITGYGGSIGNGESTYLGGERTPFDAGTGSAARFFYCAKASKKDRDEGLGGFTPQQTNFAAGTGLKNNGDGSVLRTEPTNKNYHPTVKPTELMRYLCRLVTPPQRRVVNPDGSTAFYIPIILDPFAGSGSTGKGAALEGFQFLGFELDPEYTAIANARFEAAKNAG